MRFLFFLILLSATALAGPVILDETAVRNLRLETVVAQRADFEETVFALGRIEPVPNRVAAVSSRIPGRIVSLEVSPGDEVVAGQVVAEVESRQPGDPPPVVQLKSPIAGLVTKMEIRLGDPVEPDRALLEVIDLSEVDAIARVPEYQAGQMKAGTKALIRLAGLPGDGFEGELLRFGTSADRESGTIDAIFRLPKTAGLLRPGMRAEFSIILSRRHDVLSVPRAALQGEAAQRFVYVRHPDLPHAFVKTPVQTGGINDRMVEIKSGIAPTDEVVTRGAYSLSFVGGGTLSLKEALDAAHGHEHAEDGSELTADHGHEHGHGSDHDDDQDHKDHAGLSPWAWVSGVLFLLLVASLVTRRTTPLS